MIDCYECNKITSKYEKNKEICGRCRQTLKIDIVMDLMGKIPVYLDEDNRNKNGRPRQLTFNQGLQISRMRNHGHSLRKIARVMGVSHSTVKRALSGSYRFRER